MLFDRGDYADDGIRSPRPTEPTQLWCGASEEYMKRLIVMSAVVFAGSAQFAVLAAIAQGGGLPAAIGAATLPHFRFLPMGG